MVKINEPNHLKWQKKTFWNILHSICIPKLKSMIWKFSIIFLSVKGKWVENGKYGTNFGHDRRTSMIASNG